MNPEPTDSTEPTDEPELESPAPPTGEPAPLNAESGLPTMEDMRSLSAELDTIDEVLSLLDSDPNAIALLGD